MSDFDANSFGQSIAGGEGLIAAGVGAFGLPTCILQLKRYALYLIPTPILLAIDEATNTLRREIDAEIKKWFRDLAEWLGIEEYFTEDGLAKLRAKFALTDIDVTLPAKIAAFLQLAGDIYQAIEDAKEFIDEIKDCLEAVKNALSKNDNTAAQQAAAGNIALLTARIQQLEIIRDQAVSLQEDIAEEFRLRDLDPDREPKINPAYSDIFGDGYKFAEDEEEEELIRMVFGPPVTKDGQFILSVNGLYYDSQTDEGLLPVLIQLRDRKAALDRSEKWMFNYDPNLGGKGEQIDGKSFNQWAGTIFDLDLIDDGEHMDVHYNSDTFLRTLIGQRDKRLLDIKEQIDELSSDGASEAIINNFRQSLVSETSQLDTKVRRRKKQIEIAVKAPGLFGGDVLFRPGTVPINDFSYLQQFNISLAIDNQKALVIDPQSVSGIVMPLEPKFVKSRVRDPERKIFPSLVIPDMGFDSIIVDGKATDASAAEINMNEFVATEGLFAMYNFLNSDTVMPSSTTLNLNNCVTPDTYNNGQLVAKRSKEFFQDLGLAAPYFKGITENEQAGPNALGSFVKLPDTREFQDWTYDRATGFSFETWLHMPTLEDPDIGWKDNGVSSLYRLILANENTGIRTGTIREDDYNLVPYTNGSEYTKGMIFGFTIDRRWTRKLMPSNDFEDQNPSNGYGLVLAPTLSYNSSSVAFIANPFCDTTDGWLGMYIPHTKATDSGKTLADCVDEYMLLSFSVDYSADTITVFLDGEVLETSSVVDVFGTRKTDAINIPNFKLPNSFEYKESTVGSLAPKSLKNGPKLHKFFTPWILGGGYTDGNINGGFMGGEYGGLISGLRGFLGSVKFYKKSITQDQTALNYRVQQKLFKQLKWEQTVILAIGQSNMDASLVGLSAIEASANYANFTNVKIWDPIIPGGSWEPLSPIQKNNITRYALKDALPPQLPGDARLTANQPKFCPVLSFMYNLSNLERENSSIKSDLYVIKNALGGSYLFSGWGPPEYDGSDPNPNYYNAAYGNFSSISWGVIPDETVYPFSETSGYNLYPTLKNDIETALSNIQGPYKVKSVIYLQGESDGIVHLTIPPTSPTFGYLASGVSNSWANSFRGLYNNVQNVIKTASNNDESPHWIIAKTHKELPDSGDPSPTPLYSYHYKNIVRARQQEIADDESLKVSIIDIDGLSFLVEPVPGNFTGIHFDGPSLITIGNKFFNKYKEIMGYD